ncbi:hypothetical protein ACOSQ4_021256 [Xanthoceras sorbifolium]
MVEFFKFAARNEPAKQMEIVVESEHEVFSAKRAKAECKTAKVVPRVTGGASFKLKLMNMANPSCWVGFGAKKEKLKNNPGDIQFEEGPSGTKMLLLP